MVLHRGERLLELFWVLVSSNNDHIRLIIAHSSGEGLDGKQKDFFADLKCCSGYFIELKNFDDQEADTFHRLCHTLLLCSKQVLIES